MAADKKTWTKEEILKMWPQAKGELQGFQRHLERNAGITASQLGMALQLAEEEFNRMAEKRTKGRCIVCKGTLIDKIVRKFDASMGPMLIGPGSKNQYYEESEGLHCKDCGLKYEFVPKPK